MSCDITFYRLLCTSNIYKSCVWGCAIDCFRGWFCCASVSHVIITRNLSFFSILYRKIRGKYPSCDRCPRDYRHCQLLERSPYPDRSDQRDSMQTTNSHDQWCASNECSPLVHSGPGQTSHSCRMKLENCRRRIKDQYYHTFFDNI